MKHLFITNNHLLIKINKNKKYKKYKNYFKENILVRPHCVNFLEILYLKYEIIVYTAAYKEYADMAI